MNSSEDECKHGMVPEWCASCKGLKTPEEEEALADAQLEALLERWSK